MCLFRWTVIIGADSEIPVTPAFIRGLSYTFTNGPNFLANLGRNAPRECGPTPSKTIWIGLAGPVIRFAVCLGIASPEALLRIECASTKSRAPKTETRCQADQGTQVFPHPCAGRSVAGGLATRLAPPVRPRAGVRAENDGRTVLLRVSGRQSRVENELPRRDSWPAAGRQFLLVPRLRDQRTGHCKHIEFALATLEKKRGAKAALRAATSRRFPNSICGTTARASCIFAPDGLSAGGAQGGLRLFDSIAAGCWRRSASANWSVSSPRWPRPVTSCAPMTMRSISLPAGATRYGREVLAELFPRGAADPKLASSSSPAVSVPGRGRAFRRACRPRPDRRRNGAGQDCTGDCRDGDPGAPFRRRACW